MWRIFLLLGVVTVLSGLTPIGARLAAVELPPLTIPLARFGTAGLLLLLTTRLLRLTFRFTRGDWPMLVFLGALCVPINQVGFLYGIRWSNASHAGIAYALVPVLVYWISFALGKRLWESRLVAASLMAFLGAVVVMAATGKLTTASSGPTQNLILGDAMLATAAASWALFVVLSQGMVRRAGSLQTLTVVFLIGSVMQIPFVVADYFLLELSRFELSAVTWKGWAGLLYITLLTAYANYLLFYLVIARYDVTRSSVVTNAAFLITVLVESAMHAQTPSPWVAAGSLLLLGGIVLATRDRKPTLVATPDTAAMTVPAPETNQSAKPDEASSD